MDAAVFTKITIGLHQYIGIPLYILGNLGNMICLIIFSQRSWRKNVCVFYFLVCLLLDVIYINCILLGSILSLGFNHMFLSSNTALCKMYNYLTLVLSTLSPTILICASIDRLLISSQNVDTRLYSSRRLACLLTTSSATIWLIYFVHILIKFSVQQIGPFTSFCLFNTMEIYTIFIRYSTFIINVVSFVVMIILSTLSCKNVRKIRLIPRRQRQVGRMMRKKDFQLLRCLFAKDILYIICDTFLCIYFVYKFIPRTEAQTIQEQQISAFIFNSASFIHHISFCASFYIYVIISKAFRQSCQRLIWKMFGKDIGIIPEEEPNEEEIRRHTIEIAIVETIDT